jgi:hypothetical protein
MSVELIATVVTAGFQSALLVAALVMVVYVARISSEVHDKQIADDAALYRRNA